MPCTLGRNRVRFCEEGSVRKKGTDGKHHRESDRRCSIGNERSVNVNEQIRASEVRLIDQDGTQLGIVPLSEARARARDTGMDLVEVAPNASPPVCRIMDYGKYKYEQRKKAQEARKKQTFIQLKEVKFRPRTDVHDREVKKRRIRQFIGEGNKVKVTVQFRGREIVHSHLGLAILQKISGELSDIAHAEQMPNMEGRSMHMVLAPKKD